MAYLAYVLDEKSRAYILQHFQPKFPDVLCHHVTFDFGKAFYDIHSLKKPMVKIIGYCSDDSLEALVVTVDGRVARADSKVYHVTLSLDKSKGRKPVDSNHAIAKFGYQNVSPIDITGELVTCS
jgi:hypothetical protein